MVTEAKLPEPGPLTELQPAMRNASRQGTSRRAERKFLFMRWWFLGLSFGGEKETLSESPYRHEWDDACQLQAQSDIHAVFQLRPTQDLYRGQDLIGLLEIPCALAHDLFLQPHVIFEQLAGAILGHVRVSVGILQHQIHQAVPKCVHVGSIGLIERAKSSAFVRAEMQ